MQKIYLIYFIVVSVYFSILIITFQYMIKHQTLQLNSTPAFNSETRHFEKLMKSDVPFKAANGNKRESVRRYAATPHPAVNKTLLSYMKEENIKEPLSNIEEFGSNLADDALIIVIQVHKRLSFLKLLVDSLCNVRGIESSIIIFSHDCFLQEIERFIKGIKQFRYVQTYFPFNSQVYFKQFPGNDDRDCIGKDKTRKTCRNYEWVDTYGNYRDAHFTQIKHHWWWKINRVFDNMTLTRNFHGGFLFLEEDQYVSPDVIHVYRKMRKLKNLSSTPCNILNVGNQNVIQRGIKNKIVESTWLSSRLNIGFIIDRPCWNSLLRGKSHFCSYDDYNWDCTLLSYPQKLSTLVLYPSRVLHTGLCGFHQKTLKCDMDKIAESAKATIKSIGKELFPEEIQIFSQNITVRKTKRKNWGGWGDPRDKELCMNILRGTADTLVAD